jgi:hypothetical protein
LLSKKKVFLGIGGVTMIGLVYPLIIPLISIIGGVLYSYPIGYIVGDLRWLQVIAVNVILFNSYGYRKEILYDLKYVFYIGILINSIFIVMQIVAASSGDPPVLLEWWYKDVPESHDRPLGFQWNRFSGGIGQPSSLGFFASVSISYGLSVMKNGVHKIILLFGSLLLLIASGSRTALVSAIVVILIYFLIHLNEFGIGNIFYGVVITSIAILVAITLNLGRIADPDRYQELSRIITGDVGYQEVAGRGKSWSKAINKRNNNFTFFGTLSNPSHVYDRLIIDSGYLHVFSRLGPFGFLMLGVFLLSPLIYIPFGANMENPLFPYLIIIIVSLMAINQNTFTGIPAKSFIVLGLFILSVRNH